MKDPLNKTKSKMLEGEIPRRSFGTFQDDVGSNEKIVKCRKPEFRDVLPQIIASCISLSSVPQAGLNMAFSGVLIPQLAKDPNMQSFSKDSASWIASLVTIAYPIGALFVGPLLDNIGRRRTCIITNIPILVGWSFIYFATTDLWPIYIGRVLCGFGGGMTTAGLVYTAEVSHSSYRSMLLSLNSVNIAFGILLTTVLGVYLEWHVCALLFGALAAVSFALSFFIPESPHWLVNFTSTPAEEVAKHVRWLNRPQWTTMDTSKALDDLQTTASDDGLSSQQMFDEEWERLEECKAKQKAAAEEQLLLTSTTAAQKLNAKIAVFFERSSIKPLTILLIIFFFQQGSGIYVIIFYTVNIFRSLGGGFGFGFDEYTATSAVGILKFSMSIVSTVLSKFVGRRPILIVSSIGMGAACITAAICLSINGITTVDFGDGSNATALNVTSYVDDSMVRPEVLASAIEAAPNPTHVVSSWWILMAILLFVSAGSIGQMSIPWPLMGELLPTQLRASGTGFISCYSSILQFVVIKTFPGLLDYTTLPALFITYSLMSFSSAVYVYFFLPETFRKSFAEIAQIFEKKSLTTNGPLSS